MLQPERSIKSDMVANDKLRRMQEAVKNNNDTIQDKIPDEGTTLIAKHHSPSSTRGDCHSPPEDVKQSCFFKPLPSAKIRQRKKPVSMFEIQPNVTEIIEIQEMCIERGAQQDVKESVTVLPELSSSVQFPETKCASNGLRQDLPKPTARKDNGWIGLGSKQDPPSIPMCSATPPVYPNLRRRSLGVLTTPAWGLRTYRDPEKTETNGSLPLRRRSLVLPVRHVEDQQVRRKSLVSPDVTELTAPRDCRNNRQLCNSADDLRKPNDQKQLDFENNTHDDDQEHIINHVTVKLNNADSDDEFRPRLRSRSLDDLTTIARQNVLNRHQLSQHEASKRENSRRKSFEVWLTEKEQETMRKLQMLALEKHRASEDGAKRKVQRKGKTYKEWLSDKNNMAAVKDEGSNEKVDEITKQERQEIAKRRYDKWLMEKEMKAIEREQDMLKEAKLKTIEMRKKYEERKKNKLRFLKSSHF